MLQLSERTKELLNILTKYSNNTRYTWIILNLVSLILLGGLINEKYGGTRPRIAVRHWNSNMLLIDSLCSPVQVVKDSVSSTENKKELSNLDNLKIKLSRQLVDIDKTELQDLRAQQLLEYESVNIPLVGVSISSRDMTFIGAIGLLIIYLWYLLSIIKERSVLAQLIYPLVAKSTDTKAKKLWGERDSENMVNETDLNEKILLYKKEIFHMKEAISSKFLTLYSSSKKRWFEYLATGVLTFVPLLVLISALSLDVYWDFGKEFKETGMTFCNELEHYEKKLEAISSTISLSGNKSDLVLSVKLKLAAEELNGYRTVMIIKRIIASVIVLLLASICVYDLTIARSMTRILTDMNENPRKLRVDEFVDA